MSGAVRKPQMDKDRRKVLDLLEFVLELAPEVHSVNAIFTVFGGKVGGPWTDKEMAVILQGYADDLLDPEPRMKGSKVKNV